MDIKNLKTPLFILAAPRTGGSAFGEYLLRFFPNSKYHLEPDCHINKIDRMTPFVNQIKSDDHNFIVKILPDALKFYDKGIIDFLFSPATSKIKLKRRDIISQVASLYISLCRNETYHYRNLNELNVVDTVPIEYINIDFCIRNIKRANDALDTYTNFDLELYYEDFLTLDNVSFYKTPQPLNYEEIKDEIKKRL